MEKKIDENRYSRQIASIGMDTMKNLSKLRVYIQCLKGTGIEIAKNLTLAGIKSLTIHDNEIVTTPDLGANFFCKKKHINKKSRADASLDALKSLNPDVKVKIFKEKKIKEKFIKENFDVVIFTDSMERNRLISLNNFCRENKIGFIWTGQLGLYGWAFVDFGPEHEIYDRTGEEFKDFHVKNIYQKNGEVFVELKDDNNHMLQNGDYVKFKEVEGMAELNNIEKVKIENLVPYAENEFKILVDPRILREYIKNGVVRKVKVTERIRHRSLDETLKEPLRLENRWHNIPFPNRNAENKNENLRLHFILNLLLDFYEENQRLPKVLDQEDAEKILQKYYSGIKEIKDEKENFDFDKEEWEYEKDLWELKEKKMNFKNKKLQSEITIEETKPLSGFEKKKLKLKRKKMELEKEKFDFDKEEWEFKNKDAMNETPSKFKIIDQPKEENFSKNMLVSPPIRISDLVKSISLYSETQTPPFSAFWGGLIAQEVVKFTGKYTPLDQWLHVQFYETCQPLINAKRENYKNSKYRDQILLFGNEVTEKIQNSKLFLVGAGAVGCEYLKQFALIGASSGPEGELRVTDDDKIELSNLNRQFLFREEDIKKSKAKIAAIAAKEMNPDMNIQPEENRVSMENEEIHTDEYWDGIDFLFGAVDSNKARKYIFSKAVSHLKYSINCGTEGLSCNSESIIPKESKTFESGTESSRNGDDDVAACTLKSFPYLLPHTIKWGKEYFLSYFCKNSELLLDLYQNSENLLSKLNQENTTESNDVVKYFRTIEPILNPEGELIKILAQMARKSFDELFYEDILKLIEDHPEDSVTEDNVQFWTSPKRFPEATKFDPKDKLHKLFIKSFIKIFSQILDIKFTKEELRSALGSTTPNSEILDEKESNLDYMRKINPKILEFEKDDDENGHIDFIYACSILRARNYKIEERERYVVKEIAGNIVPALPSTTTMIVGLCGIEFYKWALDKPPCYFRKYYSELGTPSWNFRYLEQPLKIKDEEVDPKLFLPTKAIPEYHTKWNFIDYQGPRKKLRNLIEFFKEEHGYQATEIKINRGCMIYRVDKVEYQGNFDKLLEEIYAEYSGNSGKNVRGWKKFLEFKITAVEYENSDEVYCRVPVIRYFL